MEENTVTTCIQCKQRWSFRAAFRQQPLLLQERKAACPHCAFEQYVRLDDSVFLLFIFLPIVLVILKITFGLPGSFYGFGAAAGFISLSLLTPFLTKARAWKEPSPWEEFRRRKA
ncbi:hypothetical protein JF544_13885 [Halobacillus kuroshimensis]|uniref:Cxxc_20_cxxc protein n=2 Tax=Halobacillus kuroshimensis TaxID=302481 RepID=A0ABS3DYA6_9BACI|nr:hypothetical protein [Halobacillus kuroshimensis]MBN8236353.1 hypothetical protein [Halobacillus kuroshimensis]